MLHHIDIDLVPDPEFARSQLMSALYAKLHRALVAHQTGRIGVSFPGYSLAGRGVGNTLRLIGPESDLQALMQTDWLKGLRDHAELSALRQVPLQAPHRGLRRVQAKSNPQRLQRRQMRRHGLTAEQACKKVPDDVAERLALPFIAINSASTGQRFRLFLSLTAALAVGTDGAFNAYGMSPTATLPWF